MSKKHDSFTPKMVSKFKKISHPKSITLFSIYLCPTGDPKDLASQVGKTTFDPVYICSSYEEAALAIERLVFLNHSAHFLEWCKIHNHPVNFDDSWETYSSTILTDESGEYTDPLDCYVIAQTEHDFEIFVGGIRSLMGINPLLIEPSCLIELETIERVKGSIPTTCETLAKVDEYSARALEAYEKRKNKNI